MAITFKKDSSAQSTDQAFGDLVIEKLGASPSLWAQVKSLGFTVEKGINKILFKNSAGETVADVKAVQGALQFLLDGNLGETSKGHLKASCEQTLKKLINDEGSQGVKMAAPVSKPFGGGAPLKSIFSEPKKEYPTDGLIDPTQAKPKKEEPFSWHKPQVKVGGETDPPFVTTKKPMKGKVGEVSIANMEVMTPVKLNQSTMLYQPVQGTSPGARYFVVAISQDLKIAARWKGQDLSLRVEGSIKKHKTTLEENGFNIGADEDYASLHVKCPTVLLAKRVIGAVLVGMEMELQSELPKFVALIGKGK